VTLNYHETSRYECLSTTTFRRFLAAREVWECGQSSVFEYSEMTAEQLRKQGQPDEAFKTLVPVVCVCDKRARRNLDKFEAVCGLWHRDGHHGIEKGGRTNALVPSFRPGGTGT